MAEEIDFFFCSVLKAVSVMPIPAVKESIIATWGSRPQERLTAFPCDPLLPDADAVYFRAIDVHAPAAVLFRWLCQLRAAPYSYDRLDNGGHRSPRHLVPGLEDLAVGQRIMSIFTLASFVPDTHLTLEMTAPRAVALFGRIAMTYAIFPQGVDRCRLVAKLLVRYPRTPRGALMRRVLPLGDLIMMRKQLRTLGRYAERSFHPD